MGALHDEVIGMFEKNSLLASFTKSESQPNALAWLSLSALSHGGISCHLKLGGPPRFTFKVAPPKGMLSMGSAGGCCLLGLGDCLGTGVGEAAEAGCSSTGEAHCNGMNGGDGGVCPNKMW